MFEPFIRTLEDFLAAEVTQAELVLDPWLPERGLAMIAGPRGGGKTMLGLACALAIAGGGEVLGWSAPQARRVLYVDGEMALAEMQDRVAALAIETDMRAASRNLMFYCDADQPNGIPNLILNPRSRAAIEEVMQDRDIEVLFLDNLSALCNSEAENDVESWTVMQDWLRKLRRAGYTVVFLHHTGKADDKGFVKQRGTSKREDILNTSIVLKPEGVRGFQVLFTKHRGFSPKHELHAVMSFKPGRYMITAPEVLSEKKLDMKKLEAELG